MNQNDIKITDEDFQEEYGEIEQREPVAFEASTDDYDPINFADELVKKDAQIAELKQGLYNLAWEFVRHRNLATNGNETKTVLKKLEKQARSIISNA